MNKAELRQHFRQQRKQLSIEQRELAAHHLVQQLKMHSFYQTATRLALYLANDGEISTQYILQDAWAAHKVCYLPILSRDPQSPLSFMRYHKDSAMNQNTFGISEPVFLAEEALPSQQLDLVLLPLVAFDEQGNRVGMGGGFYDRTFAFVKKYPQPPMPLIGLAYDQQKASAIPCDVWDVPLSGIITNTRYYDTSRRNS